MNKNYENPELEVLAFTETDIVTASPITSGWDGTNGEVNSQCPTTWDQFGIN